MTEANQKLKPIAVHTDDSVGRARPWQHVLRESVRDIAELAELLQIPLNVLEERALIASDFELIVPRGFVGRMQKGDLDDPLLLQVLPQRAEAETNRAYSEDPLAERSSSESGVVRKYSGRALLVTTGACPVHCRYCFRRHFPYARELAARSDWHDALHVLQSTPGIEEVILSGGDPLSLTNEKLAELFRKLEQLPDITTIRLHTRFPIVIPERVDAGLIELFRKTKLRTVVVVHTNHANEIDISVSEALGSLARTANALLNQSVLLKGINDSSAVLIALSKRLFEAHVMPYYLHALDRVKGAAHYEVDQQRAIQILQGMQAALPGYLVPKLVREVPGRLSKVSIL